MSVIGIDASRTAVTQKTGVEWYAYHLIKNLSLVAKNNQFILYTSKSLSAEQSSEKFKEKLLGWPIKKFWTLGRLCLEMLVNKPEVLFVPSHILPFVGGQKNVITWHDVAYKHYPQYYSKKQLISLRIGESNARRLADVIITVSEFSKQDILDNFNFSKDKVKVVHLGYDSQVFRNNYQEEKIQSVLKKYKLSKPYFIYTGRLELKKNIGNLVKSFELFCQNNQSQHQLLLVGKKGYGAKQILEIISRSKFKERIRLLDWLPQAELPLLFGAAAGLVFISAYEGFGLPVLEAMACGCPVIVSNRGALPEIAGQAAYTVEPSDLESIAKAMEDLSTNSQLKDQFVQRGLERVKEFSWRKCASQTLEILENLC